MEPGRGSNLPGILSLLKDTLYQPGVLFLSFSAFSFFVAYIGIMTFTAGFLKTEMELPSDQIGALISVTGITGVMISPVAGYLGDRMGRIRVFLAGSTAALLCILCMVAVPFSYWPYLALFLLFGTGTATAWTSLNTLAVEIVPAFRKPVTSVYNAIKFGGYAFSPVILSPLYGPNRLRAVQWGCMGAILISGVLALRSAAASRGTLTPET
jgi:MFS family permease